MIDSDSSAISTGSHDCHNAHCCVHNSPSSGTSSFCGSASRLRRAASSPATTAWVHFVVGGIGTGKTSWIACATKSLLLEEHVDEFVSVHTVVEQYHNATSRRSTTTTTAQQPQGKDIDSSSHTVQQLRRIIHGWADKDVTTGSVVIPETNTLTNTSGHSDATLQVSASAADVASIVSSLVFPKDILVGHTTSRSPLDDVDQHARLLNKHVFVECAGESLDAVQMVLTELAARRSQLYETDEGEALNVVLRFSVTVCFPCDACGDTVCGGGAGADAYILAAFPSCWPRTAVGLCASCPPTVATRRPPPCPTPGAGMATLGSILIVSHSPGSPTAMCAAATNPLHEQLKQWRQLIAHYERWHTHRAVHEDSSVASSSSPTGDGVEIAETALQLRQRVPLPKYIVHELRTVAPVSIFRLVRFLNDQVVEGSAAVTNDGVVPFKLLRVKGFVRSSRCNTKRFLLDLSAVHSLKPQSVRVLSSTTSAAGAATAEGTAMAGEAKSRLQCNTTRLAPFQVAESRVVIVLALDDEDDSDKEADALRRDAVHQWLDDTFFLNCLANQPLRFPIGHYVDAHAANGWQRAVVVAHWDEGHAYRLRLIADERLRHPQAAGGGGDIWSPLDEDDYVRDADPLLGNNAAGNDVPHLAVERQVMFAPPKSTAAASHADKFEALQVFPARTAPISQDVFTLTTARPPQSSSGHNTTINANLTPSSLCEWGATFKSRPAHRYTAQRFEVLLNLALLQDAELVVKLQRVVANGNVKRGGGGGGNRRAASLLSSKAAAASMDPKTRWMWLFASIWEHALTELKQRMERSDQQNNTQHTIQIYPVILKLQAHISKLTSSHQEMHKNVTTAGCTVTPYDPFSCFLWTFVQATPQQQPCECGSLNHSPVVIAVRAMCALFSIPLMPVLLANNVNPTLPMTAAVLKAHISPLLADALFLAGLEHLLSHVPSTLLSQLLPSSSSSSTHTSAPGDKESASAAILNMRELFVKSLRGGELWNFDCAFSTPISSTAISPPGPVGYVIPSSTNAASPVTGVFSFHVHNIAQVLLDPTRLFYGPRFEFHGLHWYLLLSSENDVEKEDSAGKSAPPDIGVYLCVEEGNVGCTFRVDLVNECRDDSVTVEASHQFPKTYCGKGWGRGLCTAKQTLCPALGFIVATTDHQNGAPQPSPWFTQHWPSNAAAQWTALHTVTLEVQISVHPHDNYSVPPPPPPSSQKATLTSSAALSAPRLASQEQLQHGGAPMHEQLAKELVDEEDAKIRAKNFAAKFQNLLKLEDQQRRAIQHGRKNDKTSLFVECAHALAAVRQQVDERAQESASIVSHYHHLHHYDQHNTSVDVAEGLSLHQQSSAVLPPAVTSTSSGEPIHNSDDKVFRSETLHRMNVLHRDCQTLHQSTIMISAEVDELVVERRRLATRLSRSEDLIAATQRAVDRQAVMIAELRKRMDRLSKRDKRIERPSREMLSSTNDDDSGSDDDDGSSSKRSLGEHHNTIDAAYTKPPPSRGGDGRIRSLPSDAFTTQVIGKPIGGGATQQCGCERAAFLNLEDWLGMHLSTCSQHNNSHCADKW